MLDGLGTQMEERLYLVLLLEVEVEEVDETTLDVEGPEDVLAVSTKLSGYAILPSEIKIFVFFIKVISFKPILVGGPFS